MKKILTVTIGAEWEKRLRATASAVERGEAPGARLAFTSPGLFFSKPSERRWALVGSLQSDGDAGVRELARRIGRDVRRVHDDLMVLLTVMSSPVTPRGIKRSDLEIPPARTPSSAGGMSEGRAALLPSDTSPSLCVAARCFTLRLG
jgi:hypothetical protein